jgi:hypothetical protein
VTVPVQPSAAASVLHRAGGGGRPASLIEQQRLAEA